MWRRSLDPDNFSIPYLTALGDLLGTGFLASCFHLVSLVEGLGLWGVSPHPWVSPCGLSLAWLWGYLMSGIVCLPPDWQFSRTSTHWGIWPHMTPCWLINRVLLDLKNVCLPALVTTHFPHKLFCVWNYLESSYKWSHYNTHTDRELDRIGLGLDFFFEIIVCATYNMN